MYTIQARITMRTDRTSIETTTDVPTFHLDENILGITSEAEAEARALDVLAGPLLRHPASCYQGPRSFRISGVIFTYHITAVRTEG